MMRLRARQVLRCSTPMKHIRPTCTRVHGESVTCLLCGAFGDEVQLAGDGEGVAFAADGESGWCTVVA